MIKLPYGIADFYRVITGGFRYVDRTAHIRHVEDFGDALLFVRPRRFGKSLWLQTLRCYYDLRLAGDFDRLFGHLEIGRDPTPLHNRYFVLPWDFSEIDPAGGVEEIDRRLKAYVNGTIADLADLYSEELGRPVRIEEEPAVTLGHLLTAVQQTPYRLYLLIDEYDNFINEVMMSDETTYRGLVHKDGPFKQLFKSVKSAMQGRGLERIFLTGVSPVAMSDLSSGFNVARDIYQEPELAALCGFTESEIRGLLTEIVEDRDLPPETVEEAAETMRVWYNGYRFSDTATEPLYNPTNALYFLDHLHRRGQPPSALHDRNLAMDHGKLTFLSREAAGAQVINDVTQNDGTIEITRLETHFSVEDLATKLDVDRRFVASFLYYLGLLTRVGEPPRLRLGIPNLVVKKLYLDRMLELYLASPEDRNQAEETVLTFFRDGDLAPLLAFVEEKLLPVLSNRDYRGMSELTVKALFLALLFDDRRYVAVSEPELGRGYADLCLLVRPSLASQELFDLLFELKYVPLKELAKSGQALRELDDEQVRALPAVDRALASARKQVVRYGRSLRRRLGPENRTRGYAVVLVGLERLVGETVAIPHRP